MPSVWRQIGHTWELALNWELGIAHAVLCIQHSMALLMLLLAYKISQKLL